MRLLSAITTKTKSHKPCLLKDLGHSAPHSINRTSDPCCGRPPRNSPKAAGCNQRVVPRIVSPPATPMPPSLVPVSTESTRLTTSIADHLARKHDLKMLMKRYDKILYTCTAAGSVQESQKSNRCHETGRKELHCCRCRSLLLSGSEDSKDSVKSAEGSTTAMAICMASISNI